MTYSFVSADPTEKLVLTFDYTDGLDVGEVLVTPTATVTLLYGVDATPQAIAGSPVVSGKTVLLPVSGLSNNVDYHIRMTCTTSSPDKKLTVAGILPVRNA